MKGFGIYVKNDLLEDKHLKAMGISIWLWMWLLDHVTSISEEGIGKVLGGQPITLGIIQESFTISESTYNRWVDILRSNGYINTVQAPHGLIITLNKTHKVFNQRTVTSDGSQKRTVKYEGSTVKNDGSNNKTIQDNSKKEINKEKETIQVKLLSYAANSDSPEKTLAVREEMRRRWLPPKVEAS